MHSKTNPQISELVRFLLRASRENQAPIWLAISRALSKPRKNMAQVNIGRINRLTKDGETVAVLGKVLGSGLTSHKMSVAALGFSADAKEKITATGGTCLTFVELLKKNPKGTNIKIMK
jgi:large subunit ribosomal protein L18e